MKSFLSLVWLLICSLSLWANVAAPSQGGQTLTEPTGIKNIDIIRENLNIDLTEIGDESVSIGDRFINVEAIYEIDNPIDVEKLELTFVILSEARNFEIFLDDVEMSTESIDIEDFLDRDSWRKPDGTPFEDRELMYNPFNGLLRYAKVTLKLPRGRHILKARYRSEPTVHKAVGIMKGWQFAYSLAPAREWKSFGGLNLRIKVPTGWKLFSNLDLEQNGETFSGNFREIPADFISVTTQSAIPGGYKTWTDITFFTYVSCLVLPAIIMFVLAFFSGYKWNNSWLYGMFFGFGWSILVGVSAFVNQSFPKSFIPESQYASYGYGDLFSTFLNVFLIPITLLVGIVVWVISVWLARKMRG